jgi:glycosyltransferase involved in cell wall biosynthesis
VKIVYVLPAISVGGAERMTIALANSFAKKGHEVTLVSGGPSPWEAGRVAAVDPGVTVEYVQKASRSAIARYLGVALWTWRHRRRLLACDVIHCHLTYGAWFGAALTAYRRFARRGRPVIVETYHAVGMKIPALRQWLHARLLEHRDAVVLMAEDPYWRRFTTARPRLFSRTILNGASAPDLTLITDTRRREYLARFGIQEGAHVVGTLSMLRADRQPAIFLPMIRRLVETFGADVHWLYAGDGPERPALERAIREAGLARQVHITGVVEDVAEPLAVIDVFVTLTVGGVGGVAAMEAALAGLPVISVELVAGRQPADADWIPSYSDVNAAAARAIGLLLDVPSRSRLAERQHTYAVQHHSVDVMVEAYDRLYAETLRRADGPQHDLATANP